ncbi:helix-turn-helix domain-containing protein [Pseudomonas caspiana]|uniref:helix-turn-helix domain-containing protein n=1 Tax=Pseudomonas caspiana TaxID=1451454 RepID=UPI000B37A34F|nr:helix-turn-helix transcriptional regulator [Pseudomonas caspiana]
MIGNRLRAERKAKGLTQAQLAQLCGIKANAQGHYELGTRSPRADYLERLSDLGIDVLFILSGERVHTYGAQLSESEHAVIESLRSLRRDDRRTLLNLIAAMTRAIA